ncbi:MAG: MBL fold metallo-hydrolase [Anaerolineales bacterium]|nr:MBL fold metallo-hydrolase [Anaerolineales bacterium]
MSRLHIIPFVNQTLGNSMYLVADPASKQAVVIDPERDVEKFVRAAEEHGYTILYGLETHLHADFVSGVHELQAALHAADPATAYQIGASAAGNSQFPHRALTEGDVIALGELELHVVSSPGHSREHISFIAYTKGDPQPQALFSGGSLIVGGTGRTDLHGEQNTIPLARALFATMQKFAQLPDELPVYPTHGAGSFCNTAAGGERTSTIGIERQTNPFFQITDEDEFVRAATSGLGNFPDYYKRLPAVNRQGPPVLARIPQPGAQTAAQLQAEVAAGAIVLDVREADRFLAGHIPQAYGIPVFAPLSTWAGWVVPPDARIILVADAPAELNEAVLQLIRVGYDQIAGYLDGGIRSWKEAGLPLSQVENVSANTLKEWIDAQQSPPILDVRQQHEWDTGYLPGAKLVEAGLLPAASLEQVGSPQEPLLVHCKAGTRSTIAISLLERKGFTRLLALDEGIEAWKQAGHSLQQNSLN